MPLLMVLTCDLNAPLKLISPQELALNPIWASNTQLTDILCWIDRHFCQLFSPLFFRALDSIPNDFIHNQNMGQKLTPFS